MTDQSHKSRDRLDKIAALCRDGATHGERAAAEAAIERTRSNLPVQIVPA